MGEETGSLDEIDKIDFLDKDKFQIGSREELDALCKRVIERFGKPEWKGWKALNEPAMKIKKLRMIYAQCLRKPRNQFPEMVKIAEQLKPPSQYVNDEHETSSLVPSGLLEGFDEAERYIIDAYFRTPNPSVQKIAEGLGGDIKKAREFVKDFIVSRRFHKLETLVCTRIKEHLPYHALLAVQQIIKGHSLPGPKLQAAMTILEDAGLIQKRPETQTNIFNFTKIADPRAEAELRKMGDLLANSGPLDPTPENERPQDPMVLDTEQLPN